MATYQPHIEMSATGPKAAVNQNISEVVSGSSTEYQGQRGYVGVPPAELSEYELEQMRKEDLRAKRHVRIIKFISRAANTILAVAIAAILATTLHKYLSTKGIERVVAGEQRNAWAKGTKLWPTLMLFIVAVVALVLNLLIMLSYFCGVKAANIVSTTTTVYTSLTFVGHIVLWAVVAAMYRYGKNTHGRSNDLWGWTCSDGAAKIQEQFKDVVDFSHFCGIQSSSWHLSLASAVVEICSVIVWIFIVRRTMHQRKLKKLQRQSTVAQKF